MGEREGVREGGRGGREWGKGRGGREEEPSGWEFITDVTFWFFRIRLLTRRKEKSTT